MYYKIIYILSGVTFVVLAIINFLKGHSFICINRNAPEYPGFLVFFIMGVILIFGGLITSSKDDEEAEKQFKLLNRKEKNNKRSQVFHREKKKKGKNFGVNKKK